MTFGHWEEAVHDDPEQIKRKEKAQKSDVTPDKIDHERQFGLFQGSGKEPYETTLDDCTCGDFRRRRKPCKHMYRLALELGCTQGDFSSGLNKNTINRYLFSMEPETQELLYNMCKSGASTFLFHKIPDDILLPLIQHGFCIENKDRFYRYAEETTYLYLVKDLLEEADFDDIPARRARRNTVVQWLVDYEQTNLAGLQNAFTYLELMPEIVELAVTITRRYEKRFPRVGMDEYNVQFEDGYTGSYINYGELIPRFVKEPSQDVE